jgi:hypothetical protein
MKRLVVAAVCGVLVSWMGVGTAQAAGKMRHTLPAGCGFAKGYVTCTETLTITQPGPRNGEACTTDSMLAGRIQQESTTTTTMTRIYKGKKMRGVPVLDTTVETVDGPATCLASQ